MTEAKLDLKPIVGKDTQYFNRLRDLKKTFDTLISDNEVAEDDAVRHVLETYLSGVFARRAERTQLMGLFDSIVRLRARNRNTYSRSESINLLGIKPAAADMRLSRAGIKPTDRGRYQKDDVDRLAMGIEPGTSDLSEKPSYTLHEAATLLKLKSRAANMLLKRIGAKKIRRGLYDKEFIDKLLKHREASGFYRLSEVMEMMGVSREVAYYHTKKSGAMKIDTGKYERAPIDKYIEEWSKMRSTPKNHQQHRRERGKTAYETGKQVGNRSSNGRYFSREDVAAAFETDLDQLGSVLTAYGIPVTNDGIEREIFQTVVIEGLTRGRAKTVLGRLGYTTARIEELRRLSDY